MHPLPPRVAAVTVVLACVLIGTLPASAVNAAGPPPPKIPSSFGAAPSNCAIAPAKMIHVYRGTDIWVGGGALRANTGWYIANHRLVLGFGARTKYGYPQKIFWQLMNGSRGPVTLRGWNVRTGQHIWFGRPLPQAHPKALVPPPVIAWPSGLVRTRFVHNSRAPSLTFVPIAGCYVLQARWKGGGWTLPFTAGG